MTLQTIQDVLLTLKQKRKVFHSEADFQFAFAWELQAALPSARIRLEYCPSYRKDMHIDIFVSDENGTYPIELKYKSKKVEIPDNGEVFNLKEHSAQDCGRYDFLRDIWRLEQVKQNDEQFQTGYAIMLSNDPSYWIEPRFSTVDAAFRIYDGRVVSGTLDWAEGTSEGTKKGRTKPIALIGSYTIGWEPFSDLKIKNGIFQVCTIEVK